MARRPFTWYLHEDYQSSEVQEVLAEQLGLPVDHPAIQAAPDEWPFYEVAISCELDDETGEVTVLGLKN